MILVDLLKMTDYAKITDIEGKIPSIIGLAITAVLTAVENRILSVSDLVKKQIAMQKQKTLRKNILILLIIMNLLVIHLMDRK